MTARLIDAAIALALSETCIAAILRGETGAEEAHEPWPEMDSLLAAVDEARPGWRQRCRMQKQETTHA